MTNEHISTDFPYESHYVDILGSKIHYIEEGQGDPIVLLHGMPTSNYLWRNIIPHLAPLGRCIAPDLIGMGKSDKPDIAYTIFDHLQYIEKFIEALNLKRITFILHGWGSILGFHYAMQHEKNCAGLVFYEAYIRPLANDDLPLPYQEQIFLLKEYANNNDIIANGAHFIDEVFSQSMMRKLSAEELNQYRAPFAKSGTGKPLFQYLQELIYDKDNQLNNLITDYSKKLIKSQLPKLMLYSVPGFITTIASVMWAKEHFVRLEIDEVGEALHYAPEVDPFLVGETISVWLQGIEQQTINEE